MSEAQAPNFVLYEHAVGYTLFAVKEFEDIGLMLPQVQTAVMNVQRFASIVQVHSFEPFKNVESALENANCVAEGILHDDLLNFLEANLPKKRKKVLLGVNDSKIGSAIVEQLGVRCAFTGVIPEIIRGIRVHLAHLVKDLATHSLNKAELSLGHSYSRSKVKFDVHRVDNMVIQSIALLDQLDKDINLFGMRIREWYSYHFPELYTMVRDQYNYLRCAMAILDRKNLDEDVAEKLKAILTASESGDEGSDELVEKVLSAARTSMGMEIAELDLGNIKHFAKRVTALIEYRNHLHDYVKNRMDACAPSLSTLVGEQVGARLLSHAGSLTNLAKCPASTIQILGAEKALFRAIKTRSKTPKYGLLYNSTFIGRAGMRNKGRISRFLANKCALASRIDCFSDIPLPTYGEHMRQQVEDRLKFYESGELPKKNLEVMKEAGEDVEVSSGKLLKKRKKAAKRAQKEAAAMLEQPEQHVEPEQQVEQEDESGAIDAEMEPIASPPPTKKGKKAGKRAQKEAVAMLEQSEQQLEVEQEDESGAIDAEMEPIASPPPTKKGKKAGKRAQKEAVAMLEQPEEEVNGDAVDDEPDASPPPVKKIKKGKC